VPTPEPTALLEAGETAEALEAIETDEATTIEASEISQN
jgi:hypothetical protein